MVQSRLLDMPTIAFQHDVAEKLPIHGDVRQLILLHSNDHLQVRRAGIIPVDAFCLLGDGLPAVPDLLDSFFSGHGHVYALLSTYQKSTLRGGRVLCKLYSGMISLDSPPDFVQQVTVLVTFSDDTPGCFFFISRVPVVVKIINLGICATAWRFLVIAFVGCQ
nr:MAG TPA: hypothetical protein [Caudoviricetes sp.]